MDTFDLENLNMSDAENSDEDKFILQADKKASNVSSKIQTLVIENLILIKTTN